MRVPIAALIAFTASVSCDRAREGAKEALNSGGEIAGKAASEVLEGVATGVEETWDVTVELDPALKEGGLSLGRTTVLTDNSMSVYLIAEHAINDTLQAIAVDKDGLEAGRATVIVVLEPGMANYFDLGFQQRTDLKRKSTVTIR